jgi:glycosyltransferase involved in cell wall biosynthesis
MPHPNKPRIGAVILTLNEAETIATAVKSLSWCNEVFVLDSGSQDNTCEIAESLGARVAVHRQDGPFLITEQRNWAIGNLPVQSDWILFLDADEESTPAFQSAVEKALGTCQDQTAFYTAPAFYYYGHWLKRISGYPNWHPRIVLVESTTRFTGGVWEDFNRPEQAGRVEEPYIHRTNAKGLADWVEKHMRYAAWESEGILRQRSGENLTARRKLLRRVRYSLGPMRKYVAIMYLAVIRGGLLDGRPGLSYLRRMFIYELLIDESLKEQSAKQRKGEL